MLFQLQRLPIVHPYRLFWRQGVIMANTEHAKKAESNVKSAARLERTAVINGIMTKINITITAATAEILNNTGADLKHRFPLPMLCMGKGCFCYGFICVV